MSLTLSFDLRPPLTNPRLIRSPLFVSAVNLHCECPPTLLKALANSHPDREIWLASYQEEKEGIESLDTYRKITLGEYRALRKKVRLKLFLLCAC